MAQTTDFARDLARYIAACQYDQLPLQAVDIAKKSVLDTLGVSLAASGTIRAIGGIMELVREHGGEPRCSVLGFGDRVPPLMAAFANGSMAHCLDFDDGAPDGNHASSSIVAAVFAAAESRGGVTGQELITAVAVGQDVFLRIRRSLNKQRLDWLVTTVIGAFSATAGVASVLGLDADQTANALGIASLGSCGTLELRFGTGSDLGEIYAGFVAKTAVLSGMLSKKGITGTKRVFEGQAGVMNVYFDGDYERGRVFEGLGTEFKGSEMQYKPWPICGINNTYVHATLELVRKNRIDPKDIVAIRPYVGDFAQRMCTPLDERRTPRKAMDARFSMPFCLAAAAAYGEIRIRQFTEEGLSDPMVLALAQKVNPVNDSTLDWRQGDMPNGRVEIDVSSGQTFAGNGDGTPSTRDNPMSWDGVVAKFRDCAAHAHDPKPESVIAEAVAVAKTLEKQDDATRLIKMLS
jgi:2-methylcitrate dehydratase PrpD